MEKKDYYEVLGAAKDADDATIKKAYRTQAMKYHPDRNPNNAEAVERMKEVNEAYAVISDPEKRRLYDTYGHAGLQGLSSEDIFRGVDFGNLFEEVFGRGFGFAENLFDGIFSRSEGRQRSNRPQRGNDLWFDLEVTLEDVVSGVEKTISVSSWETCKECNGVGAKEGDYEECKMCRGSGQRVTERRTSMGISRQINACPQCRGRGRIIKKTCDKCHERGIVEIPKEVTVSVPKGIVSGSAIRLSGEGDLGNEGMRPGDLYVTIRVKDHPIFERHGDDVLVIKEISFPLAALGGELEEVPGLEGDLVVTVPEGTQTGAALRIASKGIPHLNNHGRGDEYVVIKVVTPTSLSKQEKELLKEFQQLRGEHAEHAKIRKGWRTWI